MPKVFQNLVLDKAKALEINFGAIENPNFKILSVIGGYPMLKIKRLFFLLTSITTCCFATGHEAFYLNYQHALVRELSDSFEDSLKLHPPATPIDLNLAKKQHEKYIETLKSLIPHVVEIAGDPHHPDCNFIEDTALIANELAVISRMGAKKRRGEEIPIASALNDLGLEITHLKAPGTMDGGDLLFTGQHLFVGLSRRTNEEAFRQLKNLYEPFLEVVGIPVIEGLHLKSVITLFDEDTLIVADSLAGREVMKHIQSSTPSYLFVLVPDTIASNVLRIGNSLIIQDGFPKSEMILKELCDKKKVTLIKLNMSELIKADGALTCGSLLF